MRAALAGREIPLPGAEIGSVSFDPSLSLTATTLTIAAVVLLVTLCVQVYSLWYLRDDPRRRSFQSTVTLFGAAMLLLVLSGDLVLSLVGWEVMGWCSYLLVGHDSARPAARRAAHKAYLVTRAADIALVSGVALLVAGAGTTSLVGITEHWQSTGARLLGAPLVTWALLMVVVGVLGKAAQLPFSDWLPDAMEGPTPASALIHAATMVAAGTVLLAQLAPLLASATGARVLLGLSVSATMVLGALLAALQADVKRLLAWSTVSQVAIMLSPFALVGAGPQDHGAVGAGLAHMYGHALFKALLFLTLGWLATTAGGTAATRLTGAARRHPVALVSWALGLAALAGVPVLVGGVSKEHVVAVALASTRDAGRSGEPAWLPVLVLGALLLTVVLTAAYSARAFVVLAVGRRDEVARTRAVMPPAIVAVLVVLAAGTTLGAIAIWLGAFDPAGHASLLLLLLVTLLVLLGGAAGAWACLDRDPVGDGTGRASRLAAAGLHADRVYVAGVVVPVLALARLVRFVDDAVIGTYVRGAGWLVAGLGGAGEVAHRRSRPGSATLLVALALLLLLGATLVVLLTEPAASPGVLG
ncbi:NADH-quinone oxidoreductase subunit L [Janibacter melonis]|uniref:NADH-quinone oxidoreductase subunit 5 family protein n=1 Tax=Janibacter melonis TaxID=262209 RepID=UPI00204404A9|nr:proton-conducting transporter membrane subunit [Janibacter melonis]MCM3553965.1 NADH-quinone oxidoreductase subunit L [Janibacter melonis]